MAWCRVLSPKVGSSSSYPFDSKSTTSFRHLMKASNGSLRPFGNVNEDITSPLLVTTQNSITWTGYLVFLKMNMNQSFILGLPTWRQAEEDIDSTCFVEWNALWCNCPHRQCSTVSCLQQHRQNLKQINKVHKIDDWKYQYIYIHIYQPLRSASIWHKVNF